MLPADGAKETVPLEEPAARGVHEEVGCLLVLRMECKPQLQCTLQQSTTPYTLSLFS